jgi:hypothetical protein
MATTFSPVLFSAETVKIFDRDTVFMAYADRSFDRSTKIKTTGDTVHVQTAPTYTFTASAITAPGATTYTTGTGPGGVISATASVFTGEKLVINKYLEFRTTLTEFEVTQSNLPLETICAQRFAVAYQQLMDDQFRDQILVTDIATIPGANKLYSGSPKADVSKTTIFGYIEEMRVQLVTATGSSAAGAILFICPKHYSALLQSGVMDNSDLGLTGRRSGRIGMMSGLTIVETSNLTASFEMILMSANTVNFVEQMVNTKTTEAPDGFFMNLMTTCVWGGKIFTERAKGIVVFYASA